MSCKEHIIAVHKDFIVASLRSPAQSAHDLTLGSSCELFQIVLCHRLPLCNIYFCYFILLHKEPAKENLTHYFMWLPNCHELVSIASLGRTI